MSYHRAERRRRARTLAAEAAAIRRQLANAVALNLAGRVLGRTKISYELAERVSGTAHGGMGMVSRLVNTVGLAGEIDSALHLLRLHKPYRWDNSIMWKTAVVIEPLGAIQCEEDGALASPAAPRHKNAEKDRWTIPVSALQQPLRPPRPSARWP